MAAASVQPQPAPNGPVAPGLTARQECAALALASGATIGQAAKRSGAGARTIRTWLADAPAFGARVAHLRAALTNEALGRLADAMTEAVDALRELLCAKNEGVRLGAARAVLELGLKDRDATEAAALKAELAELRAAVAGLAADRRAAA